MTPTTAKPKLSAVRKGAKQRMQALKKSGGLKAKASSTAKAKASEATEAAAAAPPPKKRVRSDQLKWKEVRTSNLPGMDAGGGMMMLEELDGVGIEWEQQDDGRKVARFVTNDDDGKKRKIAIESESEGEDDGEEWTGIKDGEDAEASDEDDSEADEDEGDLPTFAGLKASELDDEDSEEEVEPEPKFNQRALPAWAKIPLHASLKKALLGLGFANPTEIQKEAVPLALDGRDVVGVAETGSGKTLAYSLPVLNYLLRQPPPRAGKRRPLSALILCPTRELAIQVSDHLTAVVKTCTAEGAKVPRVSVGSVVGGLSAHKQRRILERGADILVATPGRLWDLVKTDDALAAGLRTLRFLIVDEADRMIENGHFAELEHIVQLSRRTRVAADDEDEDPVFAQMASALEAASARDDLQTFVFSATLSKDLQENLKRRRRKPLKGKGKGKTASTLDELLETLDFRDAAPAVVDLTPKGNKVSTLREAMVDAVLAEKDLYLYYFLLRYPGRSLVFVGSIDGIRRLVPLLEQLRLPVFPLHSQLQQKQRLRNLERFKASPDGVLIATDVAARGLDIPHVDHVVHFNLPRSADAYVHRSGRTARAHNPGFALQIVSPEDKGVQRALLRGLGRAAPPPDLQIDAGFLPRLKERLAVARDIEGAQHKAKKESHDRSWLAETAEAMDIDIDPGMFSDFEDDDPDAPQAKKAKKGRAQGKADALKAKLDHLLDQPLIARGVSTRYPTSGSRVIVDDVISGASHANMLGAGTEAAYEVADMQKERRKKPKPAPKAETEPSAAKASAGRKADKAKGGKAGKAGKGKAKGKKN